MWHLKPYEYVILGVPWRSFSSFYTSEKVADVRWSLAIFESDTSDWISMGDEQNMNQKEDATFFAFRKV